MNKKKVSTILAKARQVISTLTDKRIEKTMWSSPAGKKKLAKRLAAMLPPHKTYVEPFAGSAAVLFEKEPADTEVINDGDQEIVQAYRLIKRLTKERIERLRRMNWVGDVGRYKRIYDSRPKGDVAKLHRFLYITHFSYGRMRGRSFSPSSQGVKSNTIKRVEKYGPRLKNVAIHGGGYERVVRQYDSKNTAFYLDPPYAGYDARVGESKFDEEKFFNVLKSIKGKFLLTYGIRGKLPKLLKGSGFHVKRIRTRRDIRAMRGAKGPSVLTQLVVTNYAPVKKQLDALTEDGWEIEDWTLDASDSSCAVDNPDAATESEPTSKEQWSRAYINDLPDSAFLYIEPGGEKDEDDKTVPRTLRHFPVRNHEGELDVPHVRNAIARIPQSKIPGISDEDLEKLRGQARKLLAEAKENLTKSADFDFVKEVPLIKGADPKDERYVLGIVLEPEVVDSQGDIYSTGEIRHAAHRFMETFQGLGLMHRFRVDGQVKILESYLAPVDFEIAGTRIRQGTWLLAVRILSDELWDQVKDGVLTGFSIGGSARRVPEAPQTQEGEAA